MITAGEPREFIPLGREHLLIHPGDVYLPVENTPATPALKATDFSRDLLRALRGVSLKEQKEDWFLKESTNDEGEEEFYYNGKTVVWSKSNGHGIRSICKSFTMENPVQQVLWAEFNIRSCKPRTVETVIEVEDSNKDILSGVCILENSSLSIFSKTGQDFIVSVPFQVMKAWPSKFGVLFERNIVSEEFQSVSYNTVSNHLPLIFSMMHPLDDISPVIKKTVSSTLGGQINYFTDPGEVIVFSSVNPSLVVTYNKKGYHSVWRSRVTTFEEAEFTCNHILKENATESDSSTPLMPSSVPSRSQSRVTLQHNTPISSNSPSFWSHPPSRIASPCGYQSHSMSPSASGLNHMAALSRSHSPSINNSVSLRQNYTPLSLSAISHRSILSPIKSTRAGEFMEPLAPDVCFELEWTEQPGLDHPEGAYKAFLSMDITGHNFLCYFLKEHRVLKLVKFEESNDTSQWIFGSTSSIAALDAEALPALNLIIIVDLNKTLSLYTGLTKVSKVHIADIFGLFSDLPCSSSQPLSFDTPIRKSFVSSTRPPSALSTRFGDESQVLSPVSLNLDGSPPKPVLINEEVSCLHVGPIKGIRDVIKSRVTLETSVGDFRLQMPDIAVSEIVNRCLKALKYVLPRDIYTHLFVKWYSSRNAPGPSDMTCESELNAFLLCLLSIIGFDVENISLGNYFKYEPSLAPAVVKKQKTHEKGCDDDWNFLLSAKVQNNFLKSSFMDCVPNEGKQHVPSYSETSTVNTSAVLFPYIAHVLYALHLIYEDSKLNVTLWDGLPQLCSFLCELARELRQLQFIDHYWKDFPDQFRRCYMKCLLSPDQISKVHYPNYFVSSPSVFEWIYSSLASGKFTSFPYIPFVTTTLRNIILVYAVLTTNSTAVQQISSFLTRVVAPGTRIQDDISESTVLSCYDISSNPKKAAVLLLTKLGITIKDIDTWPIGIALAVKDAILCCWHKPSGLWSKDVFDLIGRCDLSSLQSTKKLVISRQRCRKHECNKNGMTKDSEDGIYHLDLEVLRLRFSQDHRLHDVFHMLQSSKPVRIALQQRPEVSDHEFIEEQERHLYNLCIRTMAATIGRGMFTLRTYNPVVTETLPIPKLCLTGRAPPRNTTVDLSHIDVPANMNMWPLFHNGVAAGLRISTNASKIDSTWMVYNKPRSSSNDTPTEHAGFLMALGLNGHLSSLTALSIHDYLCKGHELTSVGILLGVSAAKRGTMDLSATKMLSIHVEALLPPTSTELDVPPAVQVSAVMGLGLLYQGSAHHHMAEVLLGEIGRPPGPEMEHCVDRESYSLAAGLALGLVTLGRGKEMSGIADLPMADQLYHYMVGGHKRPLTGVHKEKHKSPSYQIREGDNVNVDVTSPGATLALGMMFFDTDNHAIAEWMTAPDTQFLLDMVRPDFLLLRTLSKGLILWSSIHPSVKWVQSHLPDIVAKHAFKRGITNADVDYETMSQAHCNIIAGGCFCIGLKFAGSANQEAFETLMLYAKHFLSLSRKLLGDQAGRSTIETCLNVVVLSLAMVMAGTGDLDVIRICRHLRSRISQAASYVLYGSHMVTHMALGLLFLGGGGYSLSTSPLAIGALVCAFFPKFPQHSNDNRYHLQAFYHLYVLAVEPRLIVPRLIDTNRPVYINIKVKFKDTLYYQDVEYTVKTPCLLPELKFLKQVKIEDSRYWPIVFDCDENWSVLSKTLDNCGNLFVMQNAGCLPYSEDPQGFRSLLAQSYIWNNVHAWNIKNVQISSFSSDPVALNFAACFLQRLAQVKQEKEWQQKTCGFLFECASLEKMEALPICISMIQMAKHMSCNYQTYELWQVKMLSAYEKWNKEYCSKYDDTLTLLRPDFSISIMSEIDKVVKKNSKDLKEYLYHYITQNFVSTSGMINEYPTTLPGFLLFFNVPHFGPLKLQISKGDLNLPCLYGQLRGMNLSMASVMAILEILHS